MQAKIPVFCQGAIRGEPPCLSQDSSLPVTRRVQGGKKSFKEKKGVSIGWESSEVQR